MENESGEKEKARAYLLARAKKIDGMTFAEIDTSHLLEARASGGDKGLLGNIVQIYLGKRRDNDPGADFPAAGLEVKATGLALLKHPANGLYRAKERLVLTKLNYETDWSKAFEQSHLLEKCNSMLMTCYLYLMPKKGERADRGTFPIVDSFVYDMPAEDIAVFKSDYGKILAKVKAGHAEDISESDTEYLAACPKGKNSKDLASQPFSSVKAMNRAFSIKSSYLTVLIRRFIPDSEVAKYANAKPKPEPKLESLGIGSGGIGEAVLEKLKPWKGRSEDEIRQALGLPEAIEKAKNRFSVYGARMLGLKSLDDVEEFRKARIVPKTIRVNKGNTVKESMSFPIMDFLETALTPWDESWERAYFSEARFLFLVFKESDRGYVFSDAMFGALSDSVIDEYVKPVYERTRQVLRSGDVVAKITVREGKDGKPRKTYETNFPKSRDNPVCHVRPHARDFLDADPLPERDKATGLDRFEKQCLWLDRAFIKAIVFGRAEEYLAEAKKKKAKEPSERDGKKDRQK